MNAKHLLTILLFVAATVLQAQVPTGSPATSQEYYSANKAYSGEISGGANNQLLVTVFKREGEAKTHFWSRKIELDPENQNFVPTELRMSVSDDGKTTILRHGYAVYGQPALQIVTATEAPLEIYMEELLDKLPADDAVLDEEAQWTGRFFEVLIETPAPAIYGVWFQHANKWVALNLGKPELTLAGGELEKRLNAAGLAKARELARKNQPGALQRVLAPLRQAVAGNFQGMNMPNPAAYIDDDTAVAYRFLAEQRQPEDRKFIDALVAKPLSETIIYNSRHLGGYSPFRPVPTAYFAHSQARRLGDELVAAWEKLPKPPDEPEAGGWEDQVLGRPRLFGSVSGQVRLPFPTRPESGTLVLFLVPETLAKESWSAWSENPDVLKISTLSRGAIPRGPGKPAPGPSVFSFGFGTLTPGAYRLKAVWDHRPPHFPPRAEFGTPEPGDYESAESAPFQLAAGEIKRGVVIACTNRVGDAPVFFRNDEVWMAENPPNYEQQEGSWDGSPMQRRKVLQSFSLRDAVLKTNTLERPVRLVRLSVIEQPEWNTGETTRYVTVKFVNPRSRKGESRDASLTGKIVDEHGCEFEGNASSSSGRFTEVYFNVFPFAVRTYRFMLVETEYIPNGTGEPRITTLASLTLTNRASMTPESLSAAQLPLRREIPGVAVELASLELKSPDEPQPFARTGAFMPELRFWEGEQQSTAWRVEHVSWRDRWGGRSQNPRTFCREERVLKLVARVARDFELAEFSPEETWTVPIEKIPAIGESLPLKLKKEWPGLRLEILAIGGPGEFTYEDGRSTSASKQITTPNRPGRYGGGYPQRPGVRTQEPKIYFKDSLGHAPYAMPGEDRPAGIVSRTPHVVYRALVRDNRCRYAILEEQEIAVPDRPPFYGPHPGRSAAQIQFGALEHRPGQPNAALTIAVQQAREVEFAVDRPSVR